MDVCVDMYMCVGVKVFSPLEQELAMVDFALPVCMFLKHSSSQI